MSGLMPWMAIAKCGACKAIGTIRTISYGFLTDEAVTNGEIVIGGCCVTDDDPEYACKECGWTCYFDEKENKVKSFKPGKNLGRHLQGDFGTFDESAE